MMHCSLPPMMAMMRLALLLATLATAIVTGDVPPTPVELFDMRCTPGDSPVHSIAGTGLFLGALVPTRSDGFECSGTGVGIRPKLSGFEVANVEDLPFVTSEYSMEALKNHFVDTQARGITLETWITPPPFNETVPEPNDPFYDFWPWYLPPLPVLTIGIRTRNAPVSPLDKCGLDEHFRGGYDFQLVTSGPKVSVWHEDRTRCRQTNSSPLLQGMTHIIWSQGSTTTTLFVNGKQVFSDTSSQFQEQLMDWDPTYGLNLFAEYSQTNAYPGGPHRFFPGTIHSVSIYDSPLEDSEVALAYEHGRARIQDAIEESISSRLTATAWNNVTLEQGRTEFGSISLGGEQAFLGNWTIYVEITTEPERGQLLFSGADQVPLFKGMLLRLKNGQTRTSIQYKSNQDDYFTLPNITPSGRSLDLTPDSFEFRLVALDPTTNETVGASEGTTQVIHVINRNHPPNLTAPVSVEQTAPSVAVPRPITHIEGIHLTDPDLNVNNVRVDVWAVNGTLSLNEEHRSLADFCRLVLENRWQCQGNGINNKNMTFLAEPDNVGLILSRLEFKPFYRNKSAQVVVRAYDGIRGNCLDISQQTYVLGPDGKAYSSISPDCYQVEATIQLQSQDLAEIQALEKKFLGISVATLIQLGMIGLAVIVFIAMARCLYQYCCSCGLGRGRGRAGHNVSFD